MAHIHFPSKGIIALVPFLSWRITKKICFQCPRIQFSSVLGMNMDKGGTTKNSQGNIRNKTIMWKDLREHMDWGEKTKDSRGHTIDVESGCEYGFSPKMFWNIGLKHKGAGYF